MEVEEAFEFGRFGRGGGGGVGHYKEGGREEGVGCEAG